MHRPKHSVGSDDRQPSQTQHHQQFSTAPNSGRSVQRSASTGPSRLQTRPRTATNTPEATSESQQSNTITASFTKPVNSSPESRRRSNGTPSRSNSISGVRDGIGNLNRWSQSTTSSKGSHSHVKSGSFSTRNSFGGAGGFKFGSPDIPGTQLHKSIPETTSKLPNTGRPFDTSLNPALSLPPIITLPPLTTNHDGASHLTTTGHTPSTAQLLSAAVHATAPDYFGKAWEDSQVRLPNHTSNQLQTVQLLDSSKIPQSSLSISPSRSRSRDHSQGHSRSRSRPDQNGLERNKSKERGSKQPSQKAMLSKALQKANTAVLLDNAQNFDGAMQAYTEACNLLSQVMSRSSGEDDKRKLEAIRNTYTSRIRELEKIAPHLVDDGKALPARPTSPQELYREDRTASPRSVGADSAVNEAAMVGRTIDDGSYNAEDNSQTYLSERQESFIHKSKYDKLPQQNVFEHYREQKSLGKYPIRETVLEAPSLAPPMLKEMPPPLSPRRAPREEGKLIHLTDAGRLVPEDFGNDRHQTQSSNRGHARSTSQESMSWLDTIDESGGSTASSVHSRTSSLRVRRKHIRAASGDTEAEFDAALDAAVEAAYDEGYVPEESYSDPVTDNFDNDVMVKARRKVELAKQRVRETERETAIQLAHNRERMRLLQDKRNKHNSQDEYDGNESEEEERMLEEMTRGYVMDDFEFGLQTKSALPRESDSSGFSGRTWNSSIGSNPTTSGTTLSTVNEKFTHPELPSMMSHTPPPPHPPPAQALPPPPPGSTPISAMGSVAAAPAANVRSRRLSGQNAKQLKIETMTRAGSPPSMPPSMPAPRAPSTVPPHSAGAVLQQRLAMPPPSSRPPIPQSLRQASSPFPGPSLPEVITPPTPTINQSLIQEPETGRPPSSSDSPVRGQSSSGLTKNFSSSSLKNFKGRNLSVSAPDDGSDVSPNTPMSNLFSISPASREPAQKLPAMPTLTSTSSVLQDATNGAQSGGMFLFNADLHSPDSLDSTAATNTGGPIPLEPCPKEFLLRPFWLMRALYQTIAHPRGGYISTKLFVPRDVWRVKGVKIKGLEDKIANCDYLTAALQKLSKVNTYDADAVLDEMQALEIVLEQVQTALTKKIGNEVGVQGSGSLFRDATAPGDLESAASGSKTPVANKSSFSWRRLRTKNSAAGLTSTYAGKPTPASNDVIKDSLSMATVPMTSQLASIRFVKRDVSTANFAGPNGNYMSALARLFDAAQVVDQIARQVEDPGLRHADKTQVGLELSTRHASEFFGFYICRFVLADMTLLMDKFIKRGSEWVTV